MILSAINNKKKFIILFKLLLGVFLIEGILSSCASSNQRSSEAVHNYVYKYENNAPIIVNHIAAYNGNNYTIYLSINVRRLRSDSTADSFFKNIQLGYKQKSEYGGASIVSVDSIPLSQLTVQKKKDVFICQFSIPKDVNFPPFLFIEVTDKKTEYSIIEDILLEIEGQPAFSNAILFDITDSVPVFENFAIAGRPYKILSNSETDNLFVNLIRNQFPAAPAPMSTIQKPVPKKLDIDSIYTIRANERITFDSTGLYLIQQDTSQNEGLGFRVEQGKYPKYTKLETLIKPLIYISTPEEIRTLLKATDLKKGFDNYWLKHGGNANDGKRLIKVFYDRVEEANQRFTGYKEGWKTDLGIIFIVFGPPSFVYRNGQQEQWVYEKTEGMSQIKFTFVKIQNIYSNNHYELIRYPEYEDFWYNKVDLWRKGIPGI